MGLDKESFDNYVNASIQSGVPSLVLKMIPIVGIEQDKPIAYRSKTTINSIVYGTLQEFDYTFVSDISECGVELFERNVLHVIGAYNTLKKKGVDIEFITVRCPSTLPVRISLYDKMKEILKAQPYFPAEALCIEFPQDLLLRETEKISETIADLKTLKLKTAITGCGQEKFLAHKLVSVTPNYVFIDKSATQWAGSRNKPKLVSSMISYVESMGIEAFCEGEEPYRKQLRNANAKGFLNINDKGSDVEDIEPFVEDIYG